MSKEKVEFIMSVVLTTLCTAAIGVFVAFTMAAAWEFTPAQTILSALSVGGACSVSHYWGWRYARFQMAREALTQLREMARAMEQAREQARKQNQTDQS